MYRYSYSRGNNVDVGSDSPNRYRKKFSIQCPGLDTHPADIVSDGMNRWRKRFLEIIGITDPDEVLTGDRSSGIGEATGVEPRSMGNLTQIS